MLNLDHNDHRACSIHPSVWTLSTPLVLFWQTELFFIAALYSFYCFQSQNLQIWDKLCFMFLHSNGNVERDHHSFNSLQDLKTLQGEREVRLVWNQTADMQQHTDTLTAETDPVFPHQDFIFTDTLVDLISEPHHADRKSAFPWTSICCRSYEGK